MISKLNLLFLGFILTQSIFSAEVKTLAHSTNTWTGERLKKYKLSKPEVTIKEITIAPGEKLPWHTHPYINAGLLLRGELTVHTKNKTLKMKKGDTLVEVINTPHYGINEGK